MNTNESLTAVQSNHIIMSSHSFHLLIAAMIGIILCCGCISLVCCAGVIYHYRHKEPVSNKKQRKQSHTALTINTHSDGTLNEIDSIDAASVYTKSISIKSENKSIKLKHYQDAQRKVTSGAYLQDEPSASLNSEDLYADILGSDGSQKATKCAITTETIGDDCKSDQISDLTSLSSFHHIVIPMMSPEGDMEHKQRHPTQRRLSLKSTMSKGLEGGKKTKRYLDEMHDQYQEYAVNEYCIPFVDARKESGSEIEDECKSIHLPTVKAHKLQKRKKNEERARKKNKFDINAFHLKKMLSLSPNNSDDTGQESDSLSDDALQSAFHDDLTEINDSSAYVD